MLRSIVLHSKSSQFLCYYLFLFKYAKNRKPKLETTATMETLEKTPSRFPSSSSSLKSSNSEYPSFTCSPTPPPSSVTRLWRPAAQRNLRNQWSKLASYRQQWGSASSSGRSHATSLVNAYLSQKYMDAMELGVLNDMPDIRKRASWKLFKQQELHQSKFLSSYKDLINEMLPERTFWRSSHTIF